MNGGVSGEKTPIAETSFPADKVSRPILSRSNIIKRQLDNQHNQPPGSDDRSAYADSESDDSIALQTPNNVGTIPLTRVARQPPDRNPQSTPTAR